MAGTTIELSGDERKLLQSLQRVEQQELSLAKTIDAVGDAGAKAGREVGDGMEKAGRKGVSEFDKLIRELRKTGPEGGKQARAIEQHLQETGKQGRRSIGTIISKLGEIDPAIRDVAKNAEVEFAKVKKSGDSAFGDGAVKNLAKFAAGWISVSAAMGVARDVLQRVRQEQEKSLQSLESTADPNRRLLQVATDAEDYKALTTTADDLAMKYGISRDEARGLMFSGRSEGFEGSADFIASNAQVLGVASQATVAGQIPGLFKKEGLTAEQAINMGLVAAAESRLNFEEIASAMPGAAEGGALAGASSSETFGALSVLAGRFKSGDTAADRLKAFTSKVGLDEGELKGTGIVEAVQKLQGMDDESRKAFLGDSQEVNAAYVILVEEMGAIQDRIAKIDAAQAATGTDQSAVSLRRGIAQSDPQLRALRERQAAANQREIANERANAEKEALRNAQEDRSASGAYNRGQGAFGVGVAGVASYALRGVGADGAAQNVSGAILGGDLSMLQRSSSDAISMTGNEQQKMLLRAINFGAGSLIQRDANAQPGTLGTLSRGEVATFLGEATGKRVGFDQVTPAMQEEVTKQIRAAAAANPGEGDFDLFGLTVAAKRDAQSFTPQVKIDELIKIMSQVAENTAPARKPPPNYSAGQQAGATGAAAP